MEKIKKKKIEKKKLGREGGKKTRRRRVENMRFRDEKKKKGIEAKYIFLFFIWQKIRKFNAF